MFQRAVTRTFSILSASRQPAGQMLFVLGTALGALTIESRLVPPPAIEPARSPTNHARARIYPSSSDRQALIVALQSREPDEPFNLGITNRLVYRGTVHCDDRRIGVYENWLQWLLAHGYPPLERLQDSERLARGVGANCSERAQILKTLVQRAGRPCRFVGLNGHVVLEVEMESGWCVADPDYGVVFPVDMERLARAECQPLIWWRLAGRGYGPAAIRSYLQIVQSTDDNIALPIGSPLSPRLYLIETACGWLVWLIPGGLMLTGWAVLRRPSWMRAPPPGVPLPLLTASQKSHLPR